MKKRLLCLLLGLLLFTAVPASAYQITGFSLNARQALLVSLDTGDVLYTKGADERVFPASLTTVMTAVLLLEKVSDLDGTTVTVSKNAVNSLLGTGLAVMELKAGEQLTARQLLYCLLVPSAADAANVIAEYCAGSNAAFIDQMNARAQALGMTGTHYADVYGSHHADHYTTVNDLALLFRHALTFDAFCEVTAAARYEMAATNLSPARTLVTTNFLIDRSTAYYYSYARQGKTAYTDEAGRCLVNTAEYGGYHYLCIVMGCPPTDDKGNTVRREFTDARNLFRWAFNSFEYKSVIDPQTPVGEAPVALSRDVDHVPLLLENGLSAVLPVEADSSTVRVEPHLDRPTFDAPIQKGDVLGTADLYYAEEKLGSVRLVAAESVPASFWLVLWRRVTDLVSSRIFLLFVALALLAIFIFLLLVLLLNRKGRKKTRKVVYRPIPEDKPEKRKK